MNPRILLVDDDIELHKLVEVLLGDAGWDLLFAKSGQQALKIWHSTWVDLILLDIMMPDMDGLEVCRCIRQVSDVPIIFLTARSMEQDVVQGFDLGADDYISKPFRPKELKARIRSKLRLTAENTVQVLQYQDFSLNLQSHQVARSGEVIEISPLEFRLLRFFMERIGMAVEKDELLKSVWGFKDCSGASDTNLVEAAIRRLRRKIELDPANPHLIQTVWGVGYRFGNP